MDSGSEVSFFCYGYNRIMAPAWVLFNGKTGAVSQVVHAGREEVVMADTVKMNFKELDDLIKKQLNPKEHATVCMRALNKTAGNVRAEGRRAIREEYNVKAKDVELSIWKASRDSLKAIISASYNPLNLLKFGAKQVKAGVRVMVTKGYKRVINEAFIAQPSGKDWKKYGQQRQVTSDAQFVFVKGTGKKKLFAKRRDKGYKNYPVDSLRGPSIGAMMKSDAVYNSMQDRANEQLESNLKHELDYLMSKKG